MWFCVVCTLVDNNMCHYNGENVVHLLSWASQVLNISTTEMKSIIVDKGVDRVLARWVSRCPVDSQFLKNIVLFFICCFVNCLFKQVL